MENLLQSINRIIWGPATLVVFLGTGLFFLIKLRFLPWRNLGFALKLVFNPVREGKGSEGDISPFASLMTSLGACMGTGNIVGVACAMVLGGPGALIWMCISAMLGLPTIFAETVLSMRYRQKNVNGQMCGGPMYVMAKGIGGYFGKVLAALFAILTIGASFGIGNMTQSNAVAAAVHNIWHVPESITGILLMAAVFLVLIGGIQCIGSVCSVFVPITSLFYIGCAIAVIVLNYRNIPDGLYEMFQMAFSIKSISGGLGGAITSSAFLAMKWGIARGVFSNEAGLGSAPIAAAAARSDAAAKQGYIHMTGAFLDTVIMCTVTGLAIAASGVLGMKDSSGRLVTGVHLTIKAFDTVLGFGGYVIVLGMIFFAFPTLIGWAYYGEKALEYLTKSKQMIFWYRIIFCLMIYVGAVKSLQIVWDFADIMNGLMAVPNMLCLWILWREVREECFRFENTK